MSHSKVIQFFVKYRIPFVERSGGREICLNCLFHEDYKSKLSINTLTGLFQCFVCGEKGRFSDITRQVYLKRRISPEKIEQLDLDLTPVKQGPILEGDITIPYPEGYYDLYSAPPGRTGSIALAYLHNRGITDAQVYYYKLGHCVGGILDKRVIVPILNASGALLSYIARDYTGKQKPKVLTPPSQPGRHGIKDYVFNLHNAAQTQHLLIGEGVFDALSLGNRGICLFGKTISNIQLAKILNAKPQRVTICIDPDAKLEANILAQKLVNHIKDVRIATLPDGTDPNSVNKATLDRVIKEAKQPESSYSLDFIGV
jgi:hypothetical protein